MRHKKEYTITDYCRMIARNILSGNNHCGTLQSATAAGDKKYFEAAAEPIVTALVQERDAARQQVLQRSASITDDRYALEFIAQNLGGDVKISNPHIIAVLEQRLGRKLL